MELFNANFIATVKFCQGFDLLTVVTVVIDKNEGIKF